MSSSSQPPPHVPRPRDLSGIGVRRCGIATRYDKYALTFLDGVILAAIVNHHRVRN